MRLGSRTANSICAVVMAVTMCGISPAFAAPGDATRTVTPAPAPSAIAVPVDPSTLAFRAALEERQARLNEFRSQLDALDRELGIAVEASNAASEQLKSIQERLDATHEDLGAATSALDAQQQLLETRVGAMYRSGELSAAEILLAAKSIPDFFERVDFIRTISSADADLAGQLSAQRDQIADEELNLKAAEGQARSLEFDLKSRKVEIELRIAERQSMLAAAQADLAGLLDSEAARRSGEELTLWREIVAGAGKAGVTVTPYSPVETILSYHGIPYVWGGDSPSGFDCSGLTMYVMRQHGVALPHHAASQYLLGERVATGDLHPGDLVFFGSPVYHVGMYIGGGYFVQAPRTGDYVKVSKLADRHDFVGARRYAWRIRPGTPMGVSGVSVPSNLRVAR